MTHACIDPKTYSDIVQYVDLPSYSDAVRRLTEVSVTSWPDQIRNGTRLRDRGNGWEVKYRCSLEKCFNTGTPIYEAANPHNLEVVLSGTTMIGRLEVSRPHANALRNWAISKGLV